MGASSAHWTELDVSSVGSVKEGTEAQKGKASFTMMDQHTAISGG